MFQGLRAALVVGFTILPFAGCSTLGLTKAVSLAEAQQAGHAEGAGANVTGPTNAAAPTVQSAFRDIKYTPVIVRPKARAEHEFPAILAQYPNQPSPQSASGNDANQIEVLAVPTSASERVETTIGQHQNVEGIVKAAMIASRWSSVRWLGILTIIIGVGGMLWSHGNPDGYPLIFVKVIGCGIVLTLIGENPWLLLILLLPVGFYVLQKLNLLRLP